MKMYKDGHPTLIMLIGLPGSGKSTWRHNTLAYEQRCKGHVDVVSISSDDYIDQMATSLGKTYAEVFQDHAKAATVVMNMRLQDAIRDHKDIIWDQTNLTQASRQKKLEDADKCGYQISAVFFDVGPQTCWNRCQSRPGKDIPEGVFANMAKQWREITLEDLNKEFHGRVLVIKNA